MRAAAHFRSEMAAALGTIFTGLAAGLLFPALLLPLAASLSGKRKARGAIIYACVTALVTVGAWFFARLAVDIEPPSAPAIYVEVATGVIVITIMIALIGPVMLTQKLATVLDALVRHTGQLTLFFILTMALVQFAVVILRYVFGINSIFMQDSITYLHGSVFLLASGYALLTDDHVRVDIIYREASEQFKARVDLAGAYLFLFPFCLVSLWAAAPYVASSWGVLEGSTEQSGIQAVFLLKTLIPVFLVLLAMAGFSQAARAGDILRGER